MNQQDKYHSNLSSYFLSKPLWLDEANKDQPNIRKLSEQPWQQTKGALWDEVTETLCNLDFIQAKAAAKMTYELEPGLSPRNLLVWNCQMRLLKIRDC